MSPADAERTGRDALLVATGTYQNAELRDLRAPTGDVASFGAVLSDPAIGGFAVHTLIDESMDVVLTRIEHFFQDRHPSDHLLLYITGHGALSGKQELHFATPTTELSSVRSTAISSTFVWDCIAESRAGSIVLVLDCCYSGAYGYKPRGLGGVGDRAVLCACGHLELAEAGTSTSVFTSHLVEGLRTGDADLDADRRVSVEELYKYAHDRMRGCGFTPQRKIDGSGELILAKSPRPRPKRDPLTSPQEVQIVMEPAQPLHHEGVRGVAFAGATLLASAGLDGTVRLWDLTTGLERWRRTHSHRWLPTRGLLAVDASPAAGLIATAGQDDSARVWDLDGEQRQHVTHPQIRTVTLSRDGLRFATAGDDSAACVWNLSSDIADFHIQDTAPLNSVSFNPNATALARGGDDHLVLVWPLVEGTRTAMRRSGHGAEVWSVAFSPDGRSVASVSSDGSAMVWELSGGEPSPIDHGCALFSVALSPDGSLIATAGDDLWARTWDLTAGHEVKRLRHTALVWAAAFSPDGTSLATASADGAIGIWSM